MITVNGKQEKLGLALSGGGFRASIFHLGVLKRLNELGILSKVDGVSTVSGGSVVGAAYVYMTGLGKSFAEFEQTMLDMMKENVRFRGLTGSIFFHPIDTLIAMFPGYTRTDITATEFDRLLFNGGTLQDLPDTPKLVVNATSLNTGQTWCFTKDCMYDKQCGEVRQPKVPLSRAVGASAAVPGIFPPLILQEQYMDGMKLTDPVDGSTIPVKRVALSDGGVRDNLGASYFLDHEKEGEYKYLIASDATGLLDPIDKPGKLFTDILKRANNIMMDADRALLVEHIFEHIKLGLLKQAVFFDMEDTVNGQPGLPKQLIKLAANTRTDIDWFSDEEIETIQYHGYTLLDQKLRKYGSDLLEGGAQDMPGWEIDYTAEKVGMIAKAMEKSHKSRIRPYKF